jgi:osmotically inducible lipoprotein OsmB
VGFQKRNGEFRTMAVTNITKAFAFAAILLGLAACGDTWGQRAVTGGAIGAGSGAAVGALTPLGVLPGALIGGAVGAGVGAATTPKK